MMTVVRLLLVFGLYWIPPSVAVPDFISEWYHFDTTGSDLDVVIKHPLQEVPVLVDLQVESTKQPNLGFTFQAAGSGQFDEDLRSIHGGLIYVYDDKEVRVMAPNGVKELELCILNTGNTQSFNQISRMARARVRMWKKMNLPPADFYTQHEMSKIGNGGKSMFETPHNLGSVPQLVRARVELLDGKFKGWFSDSQGSLAITPDYANPDFGATIYGFDETMVRVWAPKSGGSSYSSGLFSAKESWGKLNNDDDISHDGLVEVMAWVIIGDIRFAQTFTFSGDFYTLSFPPVDIDEMFISVRTECLDGSNTDFFFYSGQSAITEVETRRSSRRATYAGLVYGYTNDTIRLWAPAESRRYVVHVPEEMGDSLFTQVSNNVLIHVDVLLLYNATIPTTTTATTTTTTTTTSTTTTTTTTSSTTTTTTSTTTTTTASTTATTTTTSTTTTTTPFTPTSTTTSTTTTTTTPKTTTTTTPSTTATTTTTSTTTTTTPSTPTSTTTSTTTTTTTPKTTTTTTASTTATSTTTTTTTTTTSTITSTTTNPPTSKTVSLTTPSSCTRTCPCSNVLRQSHPGNLEAAIEAIVKELSVDKTQTGQYARSKVSAEDTRLSATAVGGTVAITIIAVVFCGIVLPDALALLKFCLHKRH